MRALTNWFAPPVFDDEEKTRTAYLLNIFLLSLIPIMASLGLVAFNIFESGDVRPLILLSVSALCVILYILLRLGYVQLVSICLIISLFIVVTMNVARSGGLLVPSTGMYIVILLMTGMLLGQRYGVIVLVASFIVIFGLYYAETIGLVVYRADEFPVEAPLVIYIFMLLIVSVLLFLYLGQLNQALRRLRDNAQELSGRNQELASMRALLEERVASRTRGLETISLLSERLSSILDFEQLLADLVEQVHQAFDYYHVHVYILDEAGQNLMMAAGVGEAGAAMKAEGHQIPLSAPTSLVAHAARTGQTVRVDNVQEDPNWLSNPHLPHSRSEMAVPIILADSVVGVLDVQDDQIAGLDEGDAGLLRSLAGHVAVAMRNSRLFAEVEQALTEARLSQERYITQSWDKIRSGKPRYRTYVQPGLPALPEEEVLTARQHAYTEPQPKIVSFNSSDGSAKSIVAPVSLSGQTIGALQVHQTSSDGEADPWTKDDLALVQAILDQVAQSAESLRLFDETRERAGREQTIREITDKLRAAPNLEQLLNIATMEISQHFPTAHAGLTLGVGLQAEDEQK